MRVRRPDQGAAALGLRDAQRAPVAAAALARCGADRARDHGRRRRDRRDDHARHRRLGLRGRSTSPAAEPIHPDDDYGTLAPRLEELGARLLVQALDEHPTPVEQDESLVTYAHKIGPRERALDPTQPPEQVERTIRALRPHIGSRLPLPDGSFLGVIDARGRRPDPRARRRARARRGRPAAARLPRRRARADRGASARRAADGGVGLVARPPGLQGWSTSATTRRCPAATSTRCWSPPRASSGWTTTTSGSRTSARSPRAARREVLRRDGGARRRTPIPRSASSPRTCSGSSARTRPALPAEQEASLRAMAAPRATSRACWPRSRARSATSARRYGDDWLLEQPLAPRRRRPRGGGVRARRPPRRGRRSRR